MARLQLYCTCCTAQANLHRNELERGPSGASYGHQIVWTCLTRDKKDTQRPLAMKGRRERKTYIPRIACTYIQIGHIVVFGNERSLKSQFELQNNIVHWALVKCKRITKSVLTSEIYGMVSGFNAGYIIKQTLAITTDRTNYQTPELVICTDSFSLYQCLVQLGTITKKRLIINIIALKINKIYLF